MHQPFDANDLPFTPMQPKPGNEPKTRAKQFVEFGFYSDPLAKTAAAGSSVGVAVDEVRNVRII